MGAYPFLSGKELIAVNTEKQIAFDQIKEMWANLAVTDQAKEKIRNLSFYLDETAHYFL